MRAIVLPMEAAHACHDERAVNCSPRKNEAKSMRACYPFQSIPRVLTNSVRMPGRYQTLAVRTLIDFVVEKARDWGK